MSKRLSLALRHRPERLGIVLDDAGWTDVALLLEALASHGERISRDDLNEVVRTSDKQRFAISADGTRIRANQGHSVAVDLGLAKRVPPSRLFHGTNARFLESIRASGLIRGQRTHVHLSTSEREAGIVARRRKGTPVLLVIRSDEMHRAGHAFFASENGVWLTDAVPPMYIEFPVMP